MKLPKIYVVQELPQWIISSDKAAYHPFSNSIYIKTGSSVMVFVHEYLHWLFESLNFKIGHKFIDWVWKKF